MPSRRAKAVAADVRHHDSDTSRGHREINSSAPVVRTLTPIDTKAASSRNRSSSWSCLRSVMSLNVMVKQSSLSAAQSVLAEREQPYSESEEVAEDTDFAAYQSRLTRFGIWILLVGESMAIGGVLAFLAMGGNVVSGLVTLVISLAVVAAILSRRQLITH